MSEKKKHALVVAGRTAVAVGKIGTAAIPIVGGSIAEVIGVLENRHYHGSKSVKTNSFVS